MKKYILACVDSSDNSKGVCDAAIHFAKLLGADITLLHALEPISDLVPDLSGNLNFDAQNELLEQILSEEEQITRKLNINGKELLNSCKEYCENAGITTTTLHLHGDLTELITTLEKEYRLLIIGKVGEEEVGSHIKEVIKNVKIPIMLASKDFAPIKKVLFAYDGSNILNESLDKNLKEPLFKDAKRVLIHLSKDKEKSQNILNEGKKLFDKYEKEVSLEILEKTSASDLVDYANENDFSVIAMGAYKNLAIKHIIFGSFTNEVLAKSKLPLFIFK